MFSVSWFQSAALFLLASTAFSLSTQRMCISVIMTLLLMKMADLTMSAVLSDHHRGELQDLFSQRGIQVFCREPLHFCSLQAGGRFCLRLCHQPVVHWHRQGVGGPHAPSLPRCVQTRLLYDQLLPGLHHWLPVSGAGEQSSRGQVSFRDGNVCFLKYYSALFVNLLFYAEFFSFILPRKSFFSGHASFSMYTMLYLVVSWFEHTFCCSVHHNSSLIDFLSFTVLPAVTFHLAWSSPAAPAHPVHPHYDVVLHRPVPRFGPQAPPHWCPGWFYTGSPGGLLHSELWLR